MVDFKDCIKPIDYIIDKKINPYLGEAIIDIVTFQGIIEQENYHRSQLKLLEFAIANINHFIDEYDDSEKENEFTKTSNEDVVNHPNHYTDGKYEVIDFIEQNGLGFHLGNAIKYLSRAGKKNPAKTIEDCKKAIWYIERHYDQFI